MPLLPISLFIRVVVLLILALFVRVRFVDTSEAKVGPADEGAGAKPATNAFTASSERRDSPHETSEWRHAIAAANEQKAHPGARLPLICGNCGWMASHAVQGPSGGGMFVVSLLLAGIAWVAFGPLIAGAIFLFGLVMAGVNGVRSTGTTCSSCKAPGLVPTDSPRGRELFERYHPHAAGRSASAQPPPSSPAT